MTGNPAKIIITGPGRSGTTFLMQLLTRLGFDTGYRPDDALLYDPVYRAGGETHVKDIDLDDARQAEQVIKAIPQILKGPQWSFLLKPLLMRGYIEVEHIILPIRDLDLSVKSRLDAGLYWEVDPANLVESQTEVMAAALGRVVEACVLYSIPCTIMHFPTLVEDADYCYQKMREVFQIPKSDFLGVFHDLANPSQIKWRN